MGNKLIITFLSITIAYSSLAQNISFEDDCMKKNSAKMGCALIENQGAEYVTFLLDNDIRLLIIWEVDSKGYLLGLKKTVANGSLPCDLSQDEIEDDIKRLTKQLNMDNISFGMCYERTSGTNQDDRYRAIINELNKPGKQLLINVAFPGELMTNYSRALGEAQKKGKQLPKYKYLKNQIDKLLGLTEAIEQ